MIIVIIEIMSSLVPTAESAPTTPTFIERILKAMAIALTGRGINRAEIISIIAIAMMMLPTTF